MFKTKIVIILCFILMQSSFCMAPKVGGAKQYKLPNGDFQDYGCTKCTYGGVLPWLTLTCKCPNAYGRKVTSSTTFKACAEEIKKVRQGKPDDIFFSVDEDGKLVCLLPEDIEQAEEEQEEE